MDMEPRIAAWLKRSDMAHRRAWPIALEVAKIADAPAPLPTPEQAGWQDSQVQGVGDQRQLSPEQIRDMPMAQFAKLRGQAGLGEPDLLAFLGGAG
jgi:hypothetical protein